MALHDAHYDGREGAAVQPHGTQAVVAGGGEGVGSFSSSWLLLLLLFVVFCYHIAFWPLVLLSNRPRRLVAQYQTAPALHRVVNKFCADARGWPESGAATGNIPPAFDTLFNTLYLFMHAGELSPR